MNNSNIVRVQVIFTQCYQENSCKFDFVSRWLLIFFQLNYPGPPTGTISIEFQRCNVILCLRTEERQTVDVKVSPCAILS